MAEKIINTILQLRRGTAAQWEAIKDTFVPKSGEGCVTLDGVYAGQVKFGDGTHKWGELKYAGIVSTDGESIQSVNGVISIPGYAEAVTGQMLKKGADGLEWVTLTPETIGAVKKEMNGTSGKAIIFNESDGGGAKFENKDGTASFVGVNEDTNGGIGAQLYDIDVASNKGAKLDVTKNGIFYTKGDTSALTASQRDVSDNELVVKKDIAGLVGGMHFIGTVVLDAGETIAQAIERCYTEQGKVYADRKAGDIVIIKTPGNDQEFICDSNKDWIELGDQGLYATKAQLTAEEEAREEADATLQVNIDAEAATRATEDTKKVDKEISSAEGKAIIFNEADGGGAKFENVSGIDSFVGVHNGGEDEDGLAAQIYAIDNNVAGKLGAKIDVTQGGVYYTKGPASGSRPAARDVENNELATKGDISNSLTGLNNKTQNLTAAGTLSTDYLIQGSNTLILDGGSASV